MKTPPPEATSQYPPVAGSRAMPTMGALTWCPPMEPKKGAVKLKTPPEATSRSQSGRRDGLVLPIT
jgi:hypothetical protein